MATGQEGSAARGEEGLAQLGDARSSGDRALGPGCTNPARGWLWAPGALPAREGDCLVLGDRNILPVSPRGELTPSPQGKLRHGGLGQSKAASLPLALAGVLAFGTSLILYPAAISGPRQGNTPLILEGLNPAEGSSFPAASSHQRHLGHPRHTQSRVSLLPPPCLSTRREDLGGQGLWHGTADPHPHQSFPKTPRLDHLSLSRSILSTHLRALTGGCYLNICRV